jgi:hypothetical protein
VSGSGIQTEFSGAPESIKRDLEQFARDVDGILSALIRGGERRWTWVRDTARSAAGNDVGMGQALRVDSADGNVLVRLPRGESRDSGRSVAVARMSASNTVTVVASNGARLDGSTATATLPTTVGLYVFEYDGENWWRHRA